MHMYSKCHMVLHIVFFCLLLTPAFADNNDVNIFNLSLTDLMTLEVKSEVASLISEDELVVGSTVSLITLDKMRQQGVRRLSDAFEHELSVLPVLNFGGSYPLSIRGYLKRKVGGVALLIDDIPISDLANNNYAYYLPDWMPGTLNQIEMIRGPGSAIYGADAFRGVVAMKTFESEEDYYHVDGALASSSYGDGNFQISQGIHDDRYRIDISGGMASQGDQKLDYTFTDETSIPEEGVYPVSGVGTRNHEYDTKTAVLKLRVHPASKFSAKFSYYFNQYDSYKFPGGLYNSYGYNARESDFSEHDTITNIYNALLTYRMADDITVSANAYHVMQELDGIYWLNGYSPVLHGIMDESQLLMNRDKNISGAKFIIKKPDTGNRLMWLLAYSFKSEKIEKSDLTYKHPASGTETFLGSQPINDFSRRVNSFFGQTKWNFFNEKAYLLAGARFDSYEHVGEQFTPRLGAIYLPTPQDSLKLLYGRAFNAPSAIDIKGDSVAYKGNENIRPEIIDVYELIYMHRNDDWKMNLTGFYSYWKDGIILVPYHNPEEPQYAVTYGNSWKNRSYGMEASLSRRISNAAFDIGMSWVESQALDTEDPYDPGKIVDLDYDPFPKYSVLLNFYYTLARYNMMFCLYNRLYMDMKEYSVLDNPSGSEPPGDLDNYFRTDLTVSKEIKKHVNIHFSIRNLFDRTNRLPSFSGAENGILEPGISWMLRVGYTF